MASEEAGNLELEINPVNTLEEAIEGLKEGELDLLAMPARLLHGKQIKLLEAGCQGLQIQRTQMVDSRNAANLVLDQVQISEDSLLGSEGAGFTALDVALDIARIGVASEMLGSVQEVFQRIVEYLKQREQFGMQIGAFPGAAASGG